MTVALKDSAVSSVIVSPRGRILVRRGESPEISILDGYTVVRQPAPGTEAFRIYESRAGQQWSMSSQGLILFDQAQAQWVTHRVPEIEEELRINPLRRAGSLPPRQIPLLPVEQNRTLFLLEGRLMEYDASARQSKTLKLATETGLERFSEMSESPDKEIWVSGRKGLAHVVGNPRTLTNTSAWEVHLAEAKLPFENLTRPFFLSSGRVTVSGSDPDSASKRLVLGFEENRFVKRAESAENIRAAWTDWSGTIWAYTPEALLRHNPDLEPAWTAQPDPQGRIRDVAVESSGSFWLATSDGLIRVAPYAWQIPRELESVLGWVRALVEDPEGRIWVANKAGLTRIMGEKAETFRWPEPVEADSYDRLFVLPNQSLLVALEGIPLLFNPESQEFSRVAHPESQRLRFLGSAANGAVWVQVGTPSPEASSRIELFDGTRFAAAPGLSDQAVTNELDFALTTRSGDLWLGGLQTLARYRSNSLEAFPDFKDRYSCGLEAADGSVMIGAADRILSYDRSRWEILNRGLPNVVRLAQSKKDGTIWAATEDGLFIFHDKVWLDHGQEEGLPSPTVTDILEDRAGRIWLGTARGLARFQPESDQAPPLSLTIVQQEFDNLPRGTVQFLLDGVDKWQQTSAERLLFSCRVDEGTWSPFLNSRVKSIGGLRPGNHRLEVRAMDRLWNVENERPQFLEFTISAPWYQDTRVIVVTTGCVILVGFFAGLAINRHLRLIRSHAEIEKIVAIRTEQLERAHQDLRQNEKMRAIGTLAAGVAHDFNNILSIIRGSSQIIEDHLDDKEKVRSRIGRIKTVVAQGAGIVRSMVGLSRVTERDLVRCDLNRVVEEIVTHLGDQFLGDVSVRFEPDRSLPSVEAVPDLIQQILQNLLLNAADAMDRKGSLIVRLGRWKNGAETLALAPAPAAEHLSIGVVDTGSGIDEETMSRMFEPFFTTKALSARHGAGLGLTMVYQLAKEFGYGLQIASRVGHGTTFTLILPVKASLSGGRGSG